MRSDINELNITLEFKVDSFDYLIFVTTESMRCFGCRKAGHLVRACPERNASQVSEGENGSNEGQSVEKEDLGTGVKSSEKRI